MKRVTHGIIVILMMVTTLVAAYERDNDKEVVTDVTKGLMWQDNITPPEIVENFEAAKIYCKNLHLAGYNDWRLPTRKELLSINDPTQKRLPTIIKPFQPPLDDYPHREVSSTLVMGFPDRVHSVGFYRGFPSFNDVNSKCHARCVRDTRPPKTLTKEESPWVFTKVIPAKEHNASVKKRLNYRGQTTFIEIGSGLMWKSDAFLYPRLNDPASSGLYPPGFSKEGEEIEKRFVAEGAEISRVYPRKSTLEEAQNYCKSDRTDNYNDWRLPSYDELLHLFGEKRKDHGDEASYVKQRSDYHWPNSKNDLYGLLQEERFIKKTLWGEKEIAFHNRSILCCRDNPSTQQKAYEAIHHPSKDPLEGVFIDDETQLMWQDNALVEEARTTVGGAIEYCKNLNFAGHQDWRSPSLHELISLLDDDDNKENPYFKKGLHYGAVYDYSTSDIFGSGFTAGWPIILQIRYGTLRNPDADDFIFVRCVRDLNATH